MSNSNSGFKISIKLNRPTAAASLSLISGSFEKIASSTSDTLEATVPAGMYQVCIEAPGYYQEEYIRVTKDTDFLVDVKKVSAFPVEPYISTHAKQQQSARDYSLRQTSNKATDIRPNFVFFFATYEEKPNGVQVPFKKFALYNDDMKPTLFESPNTHYSPEDGVAVFSANLPVGLYFLSYPEKKKDRIIPIYVFKEKQTQVFIRCSSKSKTVAPDFFNCRIFYSDKMEFDPASQVYYTLERLLTAYANFNYYGSLTSQELAVIDGSSYLNALRNVLMLAVKKGVSPSPALELPDLKYLTSTWDKEATIDLSDEIPTLSFVTYMFAKTATPTSMLDRVAEHVKYDLFWTSFTKIEKRETVAGDIRWAMWANSAVGMVKNVLYSMPFVDVNVDEVKKELKEYRKKHTDADAIAEKLNIPITTVVRNLSKYKKIYDSIIKKEKEMDADDFFKKRS